MRENSSFVKVFGDTPINRLWEFLIDSRGLFDYSMTDICETADISWNTLKEIFPKIANEGIVKETRKIGRATMYKLNEKNPKVVFMIGMYNAINMVFVRGGNFKLQMIITKNKNPVPLNLNISEESVKLVTR